MLVTTPPASVIVDMESTATAPVEAMPIQVRLDLVEVLQVLFTAVFLLAAVKNTTFEVLHLVFLSALRGATETGSQSSKTACGLAWQTTPSLSTIVTRGVVLASALFPSRCALSSWCLARSSCLLSWSPSGRPKSLEVGDGTRKSRKESQSLLKMIDTAMDRRLLSTVSEGRQEEKKSVSGINFHLDFARLSKVDLQGIARRLRG
ncbi:hypothetical protein IWX90DRAFT_425539, partial [Phyllosticta citrichinensis]